MRFFERHRTGTAPDLGREQRGGATLNLRGGRSHCQPVRIGPHFGNININDGTLRASSTFPNQSALVELGSKEFTNGNEFVNSQPF